jgi:ATP adenylyltransferase
LGVVLAKKKTLKKKTKPSKSAMKKSRADDDGWPTKRNVFFRPNRLKYVRKMVKEEGCVFCRSASEPMSLETLCIYKSKYSQIVLNKYPYNNGHLLILPLEHNGNFLGLAEEQYQDLQSTLRLAVEAVQTVYSPHGFNMGMNHGATGGAGIPDHLHYHIVPRWNGDLNFFPLVANTKLVVETLETSYEKFSTYFKEKAL